MLPSTTTLLSLTLAPLALALPANLPVEKPQQFHLRTVTYDDAANTDKEAATKLNNLTLAAFAAPSGANTVVASTSPSLWTLDGAALQALVPTSPRPAAFMLSNSTLPADSGIAEADAYPQTLLSAGGATTQRFAIEQGDEDVGGPKIGFEGAEGYELIMGSFVMCQVKEGEAPAAPLGQAPSQLLWRGSSKAVWAAPAGCALVKLAVDYV